MRLFVILMLVMLNLAIFMPPATAQVAADNKEYTVGVDDVLEINVLQPEKITVTAAVSPDGSITFPYIGSVQIKGMTLSRIQEEIQAKLSDGYMKYPLLSVILKESKSRKFFVYGDVNKPGAYPMELDTSVLKAISVAGGFSKNSTASKIEVLRPREKEAGYEKINVDIKAVMKGTPEADIILRAGDTIMVSEGKFFVYGDVTKAGVYSMEDEVTVLKAISLAGGFSKNASTSKVKVLRPKDGGGQESVEVDIKEALKGVTGKDIVLRAGDTVIVSEGKIFVYGEVTKPGVYSMEDDITVLKAISIAGGFSKNASSSRVKVLRQKEKGEGQDSIDINIKAIMQNAQEKDIPLQPGDTVLVSEGKFFVYGEVNHPGVYYMEDNITVLKAIAIAGGFSKFGSSGKVKILRPRADTNGYETFKVNVKDVMDGNAESDIMLQPGDTVVIMEGMF